MANKIQITFVNIHSIFLFLIISSIPFVYTQKTYTQLQPLQAFPIPQVSTISLPGPYISPSHDTSVLGAEEFIDPLEIIALINEERAKKNSPPLRAHRTLIEAAKLRANVILKYHNFSHHDPYEHIELSTVLPKVGYSFTYATENIGMGDSSARGFVFGFMHSTSHRENLLNPILQDTGVAIVTGPYKHYYVNIAVQLFAIPAGKSEYLGYTTNEIKIYKDAIKTIKAQIAYAKLQTLLHMLDNKTYYIEWLNMLTEQKSIAEEIYTIMNDEQPLKTHHVRLIQQYNNNWDMLPS
ncbi:CAP domain-containing protein [Patescibacteria group bacterium]